MNRYKKIEKNGSENLGVGSYGEVYKARDTKTGDIVALKKIKLKVSEEGIPKTSVREIATLKHLQHPCVVKLLDHDCSDGRLYLVFEFIDCDLKKYMNSVTGLLKPAVIQSYASQLIQGIEYCHLNGVLHRDLKPQNLLVSKNGRLKLADFGLARSFVPPMRPFTHEVVTLWYRPPEILLGSKTYALPMDMWAVGVIIAEMVSKRPLFPGDSEVDELFKIFRMLGTPTEKTWPGVTSLHDWNEAFPLWPQLKIKNFLPQFCDEGIDLIERLLILDPRHRLSAREALSHPYLEGMMPESSF
mmetsp:Transcript_25524/g.43054  ORF Transcript_25524/g.43054 Transcript_25524/m.43054 type:complete len:300 (-) Transcript_25524:245-1144(-)|eukprot:CAMPEP_0114431732 /NCGR_PEP_ID=MMETSP0103-20121206/10767_1 /TAXON_ID=37642 ORGANISM="Paraphysomonas imperforata, Strain PA2" /NCGR_SAMPLE_ID=MMETSP0103 /ASSEMBLY_ACC=CAM_ASM_000201 /LENGTH=299 /DNA_ID=CAMNT_0001601337 /DNA_START=63 /DNA_END=962 /DNA_ORIENTATION=+